MTSIDWQNVKEQNLVLDLAVKSVHHVVGRIIDFSEKHIQLETPDGKKEFIQISSIETLAIFGKVAPVKPNHKTLIVEDMIDLSDGKKKTVLQMLKDAKESHCLTSSAEKPEEDIVLPSSGQTATKTK